VNGDGEIVARFDGFPADPHWRINLASSKAEAEGGGLTWDRRRQAAPPQPPVPLPHTTLNVWS
jgi:hypothetical protein